MAFLDIRKVSEKIIPGNVKEKASACDINTDVGCQREDSEQRLDAIQTFSLEGTSLRRKRGWEATIGTLDGNPLIRDIIEAGEGIRQSEREG